jgi:octaprenyl-diphosphate synthase
MNQLGTSTVEKSSVSLAHIFEPVRLDLERVEREYASHLDSKVALIPEIGRYIQSGGGKRVRPAVLLMAARMCGYTGDLGVLYASVVEFIHTATLVHDDMIDDATLRRGRQAVHSRWGNDITVLLGDYLYIKSMAMALTQDALDVIRLLCDITLRMIEGELYQLTKNGDIDIAEDVHFEIIHRKTAYLFSGCAEIGGILGQVSPEHQKALKDYGFNLGVAFQLVDDLLDLTGSEQVIGKPVASDLREGKVTLPLIYAMQRDASLRDLVADVVQRRELDADTWQAISRRLAECRAIEHAMETAAGYARRAQDSLRVFPDSQERDALMALPEYVLSRDR